MLAAAILVLLGASEFARRRFGWPDEVTRKTVHIVTGVLIFLAPPFFPRSGVVVLIAALFITINAAAYSRGWLSAVHHTNRRSFGTVYYPLALLLLAIPFWDNYPDLVVASILVMAIGDGAAGIVGENIQHPRLYRVTTDTKSLQGSAAMAVGSVAALLLALIVYDNHGLGFAAAWESHPLATASALLAVALFATGWEAASSRGLDNLTVPLMTGIALHICFATGSETDVLRFATGAGLGMLIAVAASITRMLQPSGAVATFLLATIVFGVGGWQWTLPIFVFFVLSSLLSKWRKQQKQRFEQHFEKTATRDAGQVAANGSIVGVLAVLWHFTGDDRLYLLSLVAVAVVTADTWGTELGVLSRRRPRSVRTGREVAPGTSGGVSLAGTIGGIAGAVVVTLSALPFVVLTLSHVVAIVALGALGSLVDSLMGATLQAQYRCAVCGKETEKAQHCESQARLLRGRPWLRNDAVNLLSAVGVTAASMLLLL
ncbi:MAG: DUF92 domain-containing protein [Bacteroidetes bacterium]|nr:DUF92 domain-containing protein [Bacteroidota bacterium]